MPADDMSVDSQASQRWDSEGSCAVHRSGNAMCCAQSDNRDHSTDSRDDVCRATGPTSERKGVCPNTQTVTVKEKGSDKPTGRSASIRRRLDKRGPPFGGHGQSHFLFFVLCQSSLNRFCVDI